MITLTCAAWRVELSVGWRSCRVSTCIAVVWPPSPMTSSTISTACSTYICKRTSSTSSMMTCSLILSTSASSTCMATASARCPRMCSVAWSTWTACCCMTIASGRSTAAPSVTWAALPCSSFSTTHWLSCPARQCVMWSPSSSCGSTTIPGPVVVRLVHSGSSSDPTESPVLSFSVPLLHPAVAWTSASCVRWTLPCAPCQTLAPWLEPPPLPSAPRPAGGSQNTSLSAPPRVSLRRAQKS